MRLMIQFGIFSIIIPIVCGDPLWEFVVFETQNTYHNNRNNCTALGMELARVDSEERWLDAKKTISKNNRHWPDFDVYIGLTYNITTKKFYWQDGIEANYTKWFELEPFNVDTRQCVVLARNADLHFRTCACTYSLYFSCSKQVIITTTTTEKPETATPVMKKNGPGNIIIGLTIGFGIFLLILALCCLFFWCCTGTNKAKVYLPPKMPTKHTHSKSTDKQPVIESSSKQNSFFVNHAMVDDEEDLTKSTKNSSDWLSSPSPSTSSGINSMNDSSSSGKEATREGFNQFT